MWNIATRTGLLALMCMHGSCARVSNLVPHVAYVEIAEQIKQAELIVVGIVESEHVVRTINSGTKENPSPLELREVHVRIEGVLEGRFNEERLTYYYYGTTGGWDGPAPNIITQGERGIFYLVNDGGVWRGPTDAYSSHTRLETGKHTISPATSKDRVNEAISRLVLLPGEGIDLADYLESLHRSESLALALVGKAQVRQMLQSLLSNPKAEIRGRACIGLAEFPLDERGCLQNVIRDDHTLPQDRKRAEELMRAAPKR